MDLPATSDERLDDVLADIARYAKRNDRDPADIALMAVSKPKLAEDIRPVLAAGHRLFGENKVQEAAEKWPDLRAAYPDVTLALIGPLQSNKARQAIQVFDRIDSVDREKIARALARVMQEEACQIPILVQVNTGEAAQKAGVAPMEAAAFIAFCREECGLDVQGLQCIPPADDHPAPHFALLGKIAARNDLSILSMGMSADYDAAIAMGSTIVRVGTAIFGARTLAPKQ
ncbi:MAG: YggS family pyridoxal phosphate-dependent enzyme [Sphingomonadales bacterium]